METILLFAHEIIFGDEGEEDHVVRRKDIKVINFAEQIAPAMCDQQFKRHFRISRTTFEIILSRLRIICPIQIKSGTPDVRLDKQLLITLWYLANLECFRSVADRFGIAKSTAWKVVCHMCHQMMRLNIAMHLIAWPTEEECITNGTTVEGRHGFPGVIGAPIDGSHIPIKAPTENAISYINRKKFHSIVLQGIVSHNMLFMDCYAGEAGSVHDATVFRRSNIFGRIHNITFPNQSHLVGDAAYPLSVNVMVPYRNNGHLDNRQINYNKKLSKSRVVIERSFALLKGRFRRLKLLECVRLDIAVSIVVTACLFHNIYIMNHDDFNEIVNLQAEVLEERRMNVHNINVGNNDRQGVIKRNAIKNRLRIPQ